MLSILLSQTGDNHLPEAGAFNSIFFSERIRLTINPIAGKQLIISNKERKPSEVFEKGKAKGALSVFFPDMDATVKISRA